jgi:hypothetical protein
LKKVCFELEEVISVVIMHNKECFLNFEAAHNAFETGILASCRLLMTTLHKPNSFLKFGKGFDLF